MPSRSKTKNRYNLTYKLCKMINMIITLSSKFILNLIMMKSLIIIIFGIFSIPIMLIYFIFLASQYQKTMPKVYEAAIVETSLKSANFFQNRQNRILKILPQDGEVPADCGEVPDCVRLAAVKRFGFLGDTLTKSPAVAKSASGETKFSLADELWVSIPRELYDRSCRSENRTMSMLQVLGLPPVKGERVVYQFDVSLKDLFRPCVVPTPVGAEKCTIGAAYRAATVGVDLPEGGLRAQEALFALTHAWNSNRTGHVNGYAKDGDYPYDGFPFTGLGWAYNWNPADTDKMGLTEFIVRRGAKIRFHSEQTPDQFCNNYGKS
jgi:hypothetical protein